MKFSPVEQLFRKKYFANQKLNTNYFIFLKGLYVSNATQNCCVRNVCIYNQSMRKTPVLKPRLVKDVLKFHTIDKITNDYYSDVDLSFAISASYKLYICSCCFRNVY